MIVFKFEFESETDVIIVNATIQNKYKLRLALDTAATHSTIDSNILYFTGYELQNSKGKLEIETANGIIIVERFSIENFECLGILKDNFEIQVYDFLSHGIVSDYDGVVGLDFFKDNKFCIDLNKKEITINF